MDSQAEILRLKRDIIMARLQQGQSGGDQPCTKPIVIVKVSPDCMTATLLLHPSGLNTVPPLKEDLLSALEEQKIVSGVNMELLDSLCVKPVYYHVFDIAMGTPPQTGADGYINYLVTMSRDRIPTISEDGIADYKNINYFKVVRKDQPLCVITFPEKGQDGMDVLGKVLEGKFGRSPIDPTGKNTVLNDDKSMLMAATDGHIMVQYGVINVIEVLTIENVDNSTGNIDFLGDVVITGNVASGFSINAGGSIQIHGNVEGANIRAGTNISVSSGLFGMDIGSISAGGDIKCRFIQNCNVKATGNIYAESILFSNIQCDGNLELSGKKGALVGGKAMVSGRVIAKNIGTTMHVPTEIVLNDNDAEKEDLIQSLQKQLSSLDDEIAKIVLQFTRFEQEKKRAEVTMETDDLLENTDRYANLIKQREEIENQFLKIKKDSILSVHERCYVEVKGSIHPNTKISFGPLHCNIGDTVTNSKIQNTDEGIAIIRL